MRHKLFMNLNRRKKKKITFSAYIASLLQWHIVLSNTGLLYFLIFLKKSFSNYVRTIKNHCAD